VTGGFHTLRSRTSSRKPDSFAVVTPVVDGSTRRNSTPEPHRAPHETVRAIAATFQRPFSPDSGRIARFDHFWTAAAIKLPFDRSRDPGRRGALLKERPDLNFFQRILFWMIELYQG